MDCAKRVLDASKESSKAIAAIVYEPDQLSERMVAQQGLFLFPYGTKTFFEENLFGTFGLDPKTQDSTEGQEFDKDTDLRDLLTDAGIVKVIFPQAWHGIALLALSKMNINAATLFPGIDGFTRSMYSYLNIMIE